MRCDTCGKTGIPDSAMYHSVQGWEKARDAGGTNVIHLREPTGKRKCEGCMAMAKQGFNPGQTGLGV